MLTVTVEKPGAPKRRWRTAIATYVCRSILGNPDRRLVLENLKATYDSLSIPGRVKFWQIVSDPNNGIFQKDAPIHDLKRVFQAGDNPFNIVKEEYLCKLLDKIRLEKVASLFGTVDTEHLVCRKAEIVCLAVVREAPPAISPRPDILPAVLPSVHLPQIATREQQLPFIERALSQTTAPLTKDEILSSVFCSAKFTKNARQKMHSVLNYLLAELISRRQVIMTIDGRYIWAVEEDGVLRTALELGQLVKLYTEPDSEIPPEYVSAHGKDELYRRGELAQVQMEGTACWTRTAYARQLEGDGKIVVVYTSNGPVYRLEESARADYMDDQLVHGLMGDTVVFVDKGARRRYWQAIFNLLEKAIIEKLNRQKDAGAAEISECQVALPAVFSAVLTVRGDEAFDLLEKASAVAEVGGKPVEVVAALLTTIPNRSALATLLGKSSVARALPDHYASSLTSIVEKYHLLRQIPFNLFPASPFRLQWFMRFFIRRAAGSPGLKLVIGEALHHIRRREPVDTAKLERVFLPLLDRTLQVQAAALLKNALLHQHNDTSATRIKMQVANMYQLSPEDEVIELGSFARRIETDLREKIDQGFFGAQYKGKRVAVFCRRKSDASIYEKVEERKIYDKVENLWDIWGIQVVAESDPLSAAVTEYLAAQHGVRHKVFDDAGRVERLSGDECSAQHFLREGDVVGTHGQRIDFYKIRGLAAPSPTDTTWKVEIQVHEEQMFQRYKQGIAGTWRYNLEKLDSSLSFEPDPPTNPFLDFYTQIDQLSASFDRCECLLSPIEAADSSLDHRLLTGELPLVVRSVPVGTRVIELASTSVLQIGGRSRLLHGYGKPFVYRFALDDDFDLFAAPALTRTREKKAQRAFDPTAQPEYIVEEGDIIAFAGNSPLDQRVAKALSPVAMLPAARVDLRTLAPNGETFASAKETGRQKLINYTTRDGRRIFKDFEINMYRLRALQRISQQYDFTTFDAFLAALGYGDIAVQEVAAEIEKASIHLTDRIEAEGHVIMVAAPSVPGLIRFTLSEVLPPLESGVELLGGFAFIAPGEGTPRLESLFLVSGGGALKDSDHVRLSDFVSQQQARSSAITYHRLTLDLKKTGSSWEKFRNLQRLASDQGAVVVEFDIQPGSNVGYIILNVPTDRITPQGLINILAGEFPLDENEVFLL